MKDALVYLKHIRDAIVRIESYTRGGRRAFFGDTMVQDAVIRNLRCLDIYAASRIPVVCIGSAIR